MVVDDAARIAAAIRALLAARAGGATICPSEVARALSPEEWRGLMPAVRAVAYEMAQAGAIEVRQRGVRVEPSDEVRGPIRLGRSGD